MAVQKLERLKVTPKTKDLPANQGMLGLVRDELKADNRALEHTMRAEFKKIDARFNQIDARFNQVDARFNQIDARFNQVDARFNEQDSKFARIDAQFHEVRASIEKLTGEVFRIGVLVEEQNSRNRVVMEGLTGLFQRQERQERRMDDVEGLVRDIARAARAGAGRA